MLGATGCLSARAAADLRTGRQAARGTQTYHISRDRPLDDTAIAALPFFVKSSIYSTLFWRCCTSGTTFAIPKEPSNGSGALGGVKLDKWRNPTRRGERGQTIAPVESIFWLVRLDPWDTRRYHFSSDRKKGKRGQVQFVRSTRRAVPANWTCPLFLCATGGCKYEDGSSAV
jgi:hypothetical protein